MSKKKIKVDKIDLVKKLHSSNKENFNTLSNTDLSKLDKNELEEIVRNLLIQLKMLNDYMLKKELDSLKKPIDIFEDSFKNFTPPVVENNMKKYKTYLMTDGTKAYKIGKAVSEIKRKKVLSHQFSRLEIVCVLPYCIENELHLFFESKKINGEWFLLTPEDVDFFKSFKTINKEAAKDILNKGNYE